MANKVKLFIGSPTSLETSINEWLESGNKRIIDIRMSQSDSGKSPYSGSDTFRTVLIHYDEITPLES